MSPGPMRALRKWLHNQLRQLIAAFPKEMRFSIYRNFVDCDPHPSERLQLKVADTQAELEACFALLHDAYVDIDHLKAMVVRAKEEGVPTVRIHALLDGRDVPETSALDPAASGRHDAGGQ